MKLFNSTRIRHYLLVCAMLAIVSCKENKPEPQLDDGTAPGPVSKVSVTPLPGGAELNYHLPDDADLFYVEAQWQTPTGTRDAKSSFYDNTLTIDGFGDTSVYSVRLYAVDRGENKSEPVTVDVRPLLPPVLAVKNSIEVLQDFGGIQVNFDNKHEANVVIYVLTNDSTGALTTVKTFYTSMPEGHFSVRGFSPVERKFAIYLRDEWNNLSDTLYSTVTPLFEEQLDKSKFKVYRLPGDAPAGYGWVMTRLWDGSTDGSNGFHTANMGTDDNPSGFPHHFTFDLGTKAKLSRFKFWQRPGAFLYAHGNYKEFEIWGSNSPDQDGSWNGWTKLLECESIKPSGLPIGEVSNEDKAYALRGEEYIFPLSTPAVRYIRVNVLSTWGGDDYSHCMEMTFWGTEQ